ncbi:DUF5675 family protein [Microbulbifer thermotolerans]|uniref:DUF5675 family protein n=1 Tax=Microbulbifer thermotolerans TaxID=252514 RepID=A0AB35HY04_MICTH|nr:DUF5675 family protein [Microbulbifer thermotolerans]MCX2780412.1 DUF5675 family protein [Microbulbifer thermotolerans]MCX2802246.1 DUF5675 family protein [Microbulbifer thermotolerans]MCX2805916.1 DUF5675 family protein [Microbulbifer thermotolerans]
MINLTRYAYGPDATLGRLVVGDETFWTVERPWLGNKPFESCIPEGVYRCLPYSSAKFPDVWELQDVPGRSKILIHVGNYASDVVGCIAVGSSLAPGGWWVTKSAEAIDRLRELLPAEFDLNVTHFVPEYP